MGEIVEGQMTTAPQHGYAQREGAPSLAMRDVAR
jgi:hypothetical protein